MLEMLEESTRSLSVDWPVSVVDAGKRCQVVKRIAGPKSVQWLVDHDRVVGRKTYKGSQMVYCCALIAHLSPGPHRLHA